MKDPKTEPGSADNPVCPVCGAGGKLVKQLSPEFIRSGLAAWAGEPVPENVDIVRYEMLRCSKCTLEYAFPRKPGDDAFYSWITSLDGYYPASRWEWPVVLREIARSRGECGSLLEVGCGSGAFLRRAKDSLPGLTARGLDPEETAIDQCAASGIEAYAETIEEYCANASHDKRQFDYICAFHCLEHVSGPRGLLEAMIPLAHAASVIFMSTPYSPMSFETNWHDPLNHPPHHLTRWNAIAFNELAAQVGWQVDLLMPKAANIAIRTLTSVRLANYGVQRGAPSPMGTAFRHPFDTAAELLRQAGRVRVLKGVAPDVVLARFRRKS